MAGDADVATRPRARIGVLVVAYNAVSTLESVLDRLPNGFRSRVDHVLVSDDASQDDTYRVALDYQRVSDLPLTVVRHEQNLGYGGNQKWGYRWAIEHELDIVVLLHGDGQYAPEEIERLIEPLESGTCDAVFGSRMMDAGSARNGGMPLYKYVGNKLLSRYQNAMAGLELSEWHSGYRAYRTDALRDVPFERNSDGFHFDTEIILQLHEAGKVIGETPIPTYYGDEICYVNGMAYAADVVRDVTRYRLHKLGFGDSQPAEVHVTSHVRMAPQGLYGQLHRAMEQRGACRVLLLGCGDGQFGEMLGDLGCYVIGVDDVKHDMIGSRVHEFAETNWDDGLPSGIGGDFDVVIAADLIGRLRDPGALMQSVSGRLAPGGRCLVGVPNFAHWYPRTRSVLGRFDYDRRGILDRRHVRFFTRRSFEQLATLHGWTVHRRAAAGVPVQKMDWGNALTRVVRPLVLADRIGTRVWPNMFGLHFLFELTQA